MVSDVMQLKKRSTVRRVSTSGRLFHSDIVLLLYYKEIKLTYITNGIPMRCSIGSLDNRSLFPMCPCILSAFEKLYLF